MATLEQIGAAKYALLTTFRKDGSAVGTPLWVMPDGAEIAFWTPKSTHKVKRIRNNPRVTVQACDFRGNTTGDVVEGQARFGTREDRKRVSAELGRKYGLFGRLSLIGSRIRRGAEGTVIILVHPGT
ncbi:PPOX class F420-dependent oxidoreductase [Actinoplanes sp. NPDC051470]|uniref:PPOX class F420-dependent oxidoreductase n=1 Tax=unclassified Actinoplanes TaxID=2626549 RepID=UPI00341AFCC0